MRRALFACLTLLATYAPLTAQQAPNRLTLDLYWDWEDVLGDFFSPGVGPQFSPDGRQIVYTRRWVNKMRDRWDAELWIMDADGARKRRLVKGSGARWSPDGTRIAFVAEGEPSGPQIFVRWMDAEGATSQITRVSQSPGALAWSPDGRSIAFTLLVSDDERWDVKLPARPEGASWNPEPKIVTRMQYRRDHAGYVDQGYVHLFVVPAIGGTPRQLTQGHWNHGAPAWTPDGKEILFSSLRVPDAEYQWRESEIYAVDVATERVRQLTNRKGPDDSPVVSPDGRLVAYTGYDWTDDTYLTSKLYVMGIDGSTPKEISGGLDRTPASIRWAADNSGVYFTAEDRGTSHLYFAPLRGTVRKITDGPYVLTVSSMTAAGLAAGTKVAAQEPGDIVTFDLKNPEPRKLTDVNGDLLAGKTLGAVEEIWYPSVDGFRIQGWIVKPPDFDPRRKYPLMLSIHGGPHGMFAVGTSYMWFEWQYYAANGYVVLYTNPRGSSGYGSAFGNAIKNAYPGKDYDDLMAGVDSLVRRGYVDTHKMFVYGCSGGGVLTAWVVGHTDRFAAASSECPVIDWFSFVGTTDGTSWYHNFAKLPWEDPSEHLRRSPLMYVGNVKTPTILITGESDLRTPISQTEEFYQALKLRKVPTAMVRLKNEYHAYFGFPSNYLRTLAYRQSWFERYTSREPAVP
jgi:dipeptidyl aminopeptidase/acylaminoacyl peptidase